MFTREDRPTRPTRSSLRIPKIKFDGPEGEMLGQLDVSPEIVASKLSSEVIIPASQHV